VSERLGGRILGAQIRTSFWLVEIRWAGTREWKVETVERLANYAESFYQAMKASLPPGSGIRKRRFVAEGEVTRGQPIGFRRGAQ